MIAQRDDVITHCFEQAQFERLFTGEHVEKRAHRIVACIDHQDGIGFFFFSIVDDCGHARPAAARLIGIHREGLIVYFRRKPLKVGMHVIGMHKGDPFFGGQTIGCEKHDCPDSDDVP